MPNQLALSKRRQSLAEHSAVLAALAVIARRERTTVMELLRQAARELVKKRATQPDAAQSLQAVVWRAAPRTPARFRTAAQLARFKRSRREFDRVLLDLGIASPTEIQARNSITRSHEPVRLTNFEEAHAETT